MMMTPPSKPWLHPAFAIGASPIEGHGLFAVQPVAVGTTVVVFGGRMVTDAELTALFATSTAYVDTLSIDTDQNLVLPGRTRAGFGNHSCDPNLWWGGSFSLITRRPLKLGDEATLDYGTITDAADFTMTLCMPREFVSRPGDRARLAAGGTTAPVRPALGPGPAEANGP